ncbi:DUF1476 domain-containing protein [Alphaproteobacteria bacterium]|nr:DUF1476 domain-containing protein [Alphaproteobacteria bacterium]
MVDNFKSSVIANKKLKEKEKDHRVNKVILRNKFLGEWAASILELNPDQKKVYISKVIELDKKNTNNKVIINKIKKDFKKKQINISSKEIQFKVNDFYLEANVIIENKFKLNNWK